MGEYCEKTKFNYYCNANYNYRPEPVDLHMTPIETVEVHGGRLWWNCLALDCVMMNVMGIFMMSATYFLASFNSYLIFVIIPLYGASIALISKLKHVDFKEQVRLTKAVVTLASFVFFYYRDTVGNTNNYWFPHWKIFYC